MAATAPELRSRQARVLALSRRPNHYYTRPPNPSRRHYTATPNPPTLSATYRCAPSRKLCVGRSQCTTHSILTLKPSSPPTRSPQHALQLPLLLLLPRRASRAEILCFCSTKPPWTPPSKGEVPVPRFQLKSTLLHLLLCPVEPLTQLCRDHDGIGEERAISTGSAAPS